MEDNLNNKSYSNTINHNVKPKAIIIPTKDIQFDPERTIYSSNKEILCNYVSENEFNMIITQINKVALASFFASRKKKNSSMYSVTFYCILLSFIVNTIIAILVGINKFQIGFIIPLIIISNASFLFVMIYIYKKRITHLSREDNFLKRYMNKHLKEINEKYKNDQIDWEWSYEPFKKEIMIKFN